MPEGPTAPTSLESLTWDDLVAWAGHRTLARGRALLRQGQVTDIELTADGGIRATVSDEEVFVESDGPSSECSCGEADPCRHGVAAVLEYQEWVRTGREVPGPPAAVDPACPPTAPEPPAVGAIAAAAPTEPPEIPSVDQYLDRLDASELKALLGELCDEVDGVLEFLLRRIQVVSGDIEGLIEEASEALEEVTVERGWSRSWSDSCYTPDYSTVTECFRAIVDAGGADEVLKLGLELLEAGNEQVEESDDEGETAEAVRGALAVVWEALSHSSLPPAQRILWMYERYLEDGFGLTGGTDDLAIWQAQPAAWNEVAQVLLVRSGLRPGPAGKSADAEDSDSDYSPVRSWAVDALAAAGRLEEAVSLATGEAYADVGRERTVELLIQAGRIQDARAMAREGIRQSTGRYDFHAANLRQRLRDIAQSEGDTAMVAALLADDFAQNPSLSAYETLRHAAVALDLWVPVRAACLAYLESGGTLAGQAGWPLPDTECSPGGPKGTERFPMTALLIEIALAEGDRDRAAALYGGRKDRHHWGTRNLELKLAEEVTSSHPDTAIAIWRSIAESCIAEANRTGYERSVPHLRCMQALLRELGRGQEWDSYIAELRRVNKRRWACIQTLRVLDVAEKEKG